MSEPPGQPPKTEKGKERLVLIATAPNETVGTLWKGILEDNGIRSLLKGTSFMDTANYAHGVFPFELYVLASGAERAKEVLTPFMEEEG
jgi:hypothetical protein